MKITLKATVQTHPLDPPFATIYVQAFTDKDGKETEFGFREAITVPAKNAQSIADLINAK